MRQEQVQEVSRATANDAVELLIKDHEKVKAAFKEFEALGDKAFVSKKKLADEICADLLKHTVIEEEIFYPAIQGAIREGKDLVEEAIVEHASAKDLIEQIQAMSADEELFDAKVKVLSEQIEHHVKEEEEEMFPQARKTNLDLIDLGKKMQERKNQIAL
ncbi:MAG: hemerythrin domain-containing protein [Pseudomonadota bacterium]